MSSPPAASLNSLTTLSVQVLLEIEEFLSMIDFKRWTLGMPWKAVYLVLPPDMEGEVEC